MFFFFKQKTAYEMRISDWSSDVCSSDLNNKSQALRIPADFELPGDRVMIHRDGDRLIIEPVRRKNLLEVLASLQPLGPDDQFPDVEDTLLPIKAIDL